MTAGEDQPLVRLQQVLAIDAAQGAKAPDQSVIERAGGRGVALNVRRQVPAERFARVAIDERPMRSSRPCQPGSGPDRWATLVGRSGEWYSTWMRGRLPMARVRTCQFLIWKMRLFLLKPRKESHHQICERRVFPDHGLDRHGEARIGFRRSLGRVVTDRPSRHAEPGAELHQR